MSQERRFGRRETVDIRARLKGPNGRAIEVRVRDLSDMGCRLEKPDHWELPRQFALKFVELDSPEIEVETVWRRGNELGVRFVTAEPKPVKPAPETPVTRLSVMELRQIGRRNVS